LKNAVTECNKDRTPKEVEEGQDAGKQFLAATTTDYFLIASYGIALFTATVLLIRASKQRLSHWLLYLSLFCVFATSIADVFEDRGIINALEHGIPYSPSSSLLKWSLLFGIFLFWGLALLIETVFGKIASYLFAFAAMPNAFVGLIGVKDSSGVIETGTSMLLIPLLLALVGLFSLGPRKQL
jgi:hypothetical protein